jgi:hypothetical protein
MAKQLEELPLPVTVTNNGQSAVATHRAVGFRSEPWTDPPVQSFHVFGTVNEAGKFVPSFRATTAAVYAYWKQIDIDEVYKDGDFTTAEIVARHDLILVRDAS